MTSMHCASNGKHNSHSSSAAYSSSHFELQSQHGNFTNNRKTSVHSSVDGLIGRNARKREAGNTQHYMHRVRCNEDGECSSVGTNCDMKLNQCMCPKGYIPKEMRSNVGYNNKYNNKSHESMFCFKASKIGEQCASQEQCFVTNSLCIKNNFKATNKNESYCLCQESFFQEDGIEQVNVNGIVLESDVICRYYNQGLSSTQSNVLITVVCLALIVLAMCVIVYWKMRSNKRSMNIMTTIAMANSEPNEAMVTNGMEVNRDLSNLPPIGSAEAEFQNDFIPVFPMHHLKPCPEKNTTALNMQFIQSRNA